MFRIAGAAGQIIIGQLVNKNGVRLAGDGFQHIAGKLGRPEHYRQPQLPNLVYDICHFPRRRLGEIRGLHRPDNLQSVGDGKISPRVVISNQPAVFRRNRSHRLPYRRVHSIDALAEQLQIFLIILGVVRVQGRQLFLRQLRIAQPQRRVRPQMRVGMPPRFGKAEIKLPPLPSDSPIPQQQHRGIIPLVSRRQLQRRLLQKQPIGDNQIGIRQHPRQRRLRLKHMGINPLRHHPLQGNAVAADVFNDAGNRRHRSNHA